MSDDRGRMWSVEAILAEISREVQHAELKHSAMNSAHEGWAVILEEVEELKAEVFKQTDARSPAKMRKECLQIAAMAVRFIRDVIGGDRNNQS